uniref:Putative endonuclease/reverse transcriptase n=1 Tax=Ixodes ricinus TaxID=34613 RepID=A0A6B0UH08_IXORI
MYSSYVSPTDLCARAGLQTLQERRKQSRLKLLNLIVSNELGIDKNQYIEFFCPRVSRYSHQKTLKPYNYKNDSFKYPFFPRTITKWNNLPPNVVNAATYSDFCDVLRK